MEMETDGDIDEVVNIRSVVLSTRIYSDFGVDFQNIMMRSGPHNKTADSVM